MQYDSKSCWFILVHEFRVFRLFCSPLLKLVVCSRTSCWYISFQSSLLYRYIEHYIIQHVSGEKLQKDVKLCMLENCGFTVFKEFLLAPESVFPLFYICQNYFFCWQKFNQALFNVDGFVSFLLNPKALCSINHLLCSDLFKYKGFLNVREKKFSSRT